LGGTEQGEGAVNEKKADTWMPLYVGAYLGATMHLTTEQHGAYLLLLMACWKGDGKVPNNDDSLSAITRLSKPRWRAHKATILRFFQIADDFITHERVTTERARAVEISEARSKAGSGGATTKWGKTKTREELDIENRKNRSERLANARRLATHTPAEWQALVEVCGSHCLRCGAPEYCKDHIVPIYQGGSDGIENLQPLCRSCNSAKGPDNADLRPPNWRELLAKRLANACGTPAQSQSQVNLSVANATGADAPVDPIWGTGLAFLVRKGVPEKAARSLLGKLKREAGDIEAGALLAKADTEDITDPIPWLMAAAVAARERKRAPQQSKARTVIDQFEALKHGLANDRTADRLPEVALLGFGSDPGE
jgi:uncharacterized protein YdaU (DUF1376 family)